MAALAPQVSVRPAGGEQNWPMTGPNFDANSKAVSGAGAAVSITFNAAAGSNYKDGIDRKNVCAQITFGYDAAPQAGATLKIEDGSGTTVFAVGVTLGGPQQITFTPPRGGTANTAMIITLSAGGGSILAYLNATVYTEF